MLENKFVGTNCRFVLHSIYYLFIYHPRSAWLKIICQATLTQEQFCELTVAIKTSINKCIDKRRAHLCAKFAKFTPMSTHDNTARKVVDPSNRALTPDETRILGLGLKYNRDDASNFDFLKHLETLINGISETLARLLRSHNIKVAHKPKATLKTTLVKAKDTTPPGSEGGRDLAIPIQKMQCQICWRNWQNTKDQDETTQSGDTQPLHVLPHNPAQFGHMPPIRF